MYQDCWFLKSASQYTNTHYSNLNLQKKAPLEKQQGLINIINESYKTDILLITDSEPATILTKYKPLLSLEVRLNELDCSPAESF